MKAKEKVESSGAAPTKGTVFYGLCGEGFGHYSRCVFLVPHLLRAGYDVHLFAGRRAAEMVERRFPDLGCQRIGLFHRFSFQNNSLGLLKTGVHSGGMFLQWPFSCLASWWRMLRRRPVAVISDYEPVLAWTAQGFGIPLLAMDHQQVTSECVFDPRATSKIASRLMRLCNLLTYPRPNLRIISSFFPAELKKMKSDRFVVGPLLREEVLKRQATEGDHIVVYQTTDSLGWLQSILDKLPGPKRVYGTQIPDGKDVKCHGFDPESFLDDLASCRFALLNGGHTAISEAIHFGKPVICLPPHNHAEQELNARQLAEMGFGQTYFLQPGEVPDFTFFLGNETVFRRNIEQNRIPQANDQVADIVLNFLDNAARRQKKNIKVKGEK